ncbi:MAG: hypothetical protein U5K34_10635 [Thiohalophilus sp.]|nr:hypothetical protein [Thiohalophilus sp.]MDZ7804423.1 hypothetical protein [Thiohalophilus sp.]
MILVDTDVLIWNLRGNHKAADLLDTHPGFSLSAVSYTELVQGVRNKQELRLIKQALTFGMPASSISTKASPTAPHF